METEKSLKNDSQTRRAFIFSTLAVTTITAIGGTVYPILRYLFPTKKSGEAKGASATIPLSEVGIGEARFFKFKGKPAVLIRKGDDKFVALSAVCTHLGCIVKYSASDKMLKCPCHGARYDLNGKVLGGPAPAPLPTFSASIDGDQILVEEV